MSQQNGEMGNVKVNTDDENTVDRKIKNQILELRKVIDDDERRLYVDRMAEHPEYGRMQADRDWGVSVRQYLRGIKRLWADDESVPIKNVNHYWQEIPLHDSQEELYPPDTDGYRFSLVEYEDQYSEQALREAIGLDARVPLPEPHTVEFRGLQSVLGRDRIEHTWAIKVDASGPPRKHEIVRTSVAMPVPKYILENAVEAADNFLQQAGLGFDVAADPYEGGGDPGL